jgi:hypothetical protein
MLCRPTPLQAFLALTLVQILVGAGVHVFHPGMGALDTIGTVQEKSETQCGVHEACLPVGFSPRLRLDWTNLAFSSPVARYWRDHQRNCSIPTADFKFRNRYGLGSDLHVWTQALCNGVDSSVRIRTEKPWIFWDDEACSINDDNEQSAMYCYFPQAEPACPNDQKNSNEATKEAMGSTTTGRRHKLYSGNGNVGRTCRQVLERFNLSLSDVRASAIEYLFSSVSPLVVREAQRQLDMLLFGNQSSTGTGTGTDTTSSPLQATARPFLPSRWITVHIRWGDKKRETRLRPIHQYVKAVQHLLDSTDGRAGRADQDMVAASQRNGGPVGIFLATEDPRAVELFQAEAIQRNWTTYVDVYFQEFSSVRDGSYNGNPRMSANLGGRPGLVAIASLLVALQSNDFVLTTSSNWSRLLNELRKNVLDPRCGSCTRVIDLDPGEW